MLFLLANDIYSIPVAFVMLFAPIVFSFMLPMECFLQGANEPVPNIIPVDGDFFEGDWKVYWIQKPDGRYLQANVKQELDGDNMIMHVDFYEGPTLDDLEKIVKDTRKTVEFVEGSLDKYRIISDWNFNDGEKGLLSFGCRTIYAIDTQPPAV